MTPTGPSSKQLLKTWLNARAKPVMIAAALLPSVLAACVLWILPIGEQSADRTAMAARDYTAMWAAGHLVTLGKGEALSDTPAFNGALRSLFGMGFPDQVWPYPPPILLLAVPLSTLPLLVGFVLYTTLTLGLLWLALRSGSLTTAVCWAVICSPAAADNALAGQNAAITGALLIGGLLLAHRRPVAAGALLGALIIKPQLGMLVPVCLLASGNWRALLSASIATSLLIALSGVLFGLDVWMHFFVHTRPVAAAILQAPWQGLPSQRIFASPFMAARSVGASVLVASCLQIAVTLVCVAFAWQAWRMAHADPITRAALTGLLALLASPWVHTYDLIPLSVAIVVLMPTARQSSRILLGFAWFWPGAALVMPLPPTISVASVAGVACLAWRNMRRTL